MKSFEPVVLAGDHVRLEPLAPSHVPGLVAAAAEDRSTYDWTPVPDGEAEILGWVEHAERERESGRMLAFATMTIDGTVVGSTSFLDPQRWQRSDRAPSFDSIEIGSTWLAASAQRTSINTEAKLLMLTHAFDAWSVERVTFKTDARNQRSRDAITRIGARFEGIRRAHCLATDGTIRDSAYFSIVASEWPGVRAGLVSKLSAS